jgi:hypothetical protein
MISVDLAVLALASIPADAAVVRTNSTVSALAVALLAGAASAVVRITVLDWRVGGLTR